MNTDKIYAESIAKEYAKKVIGSGNAMFILGIIIGLGGILLVSINYPIYKKILEDGKKKYAYEIIRLAREISEE